MRLRKAEKLGAQEGNSATHASVSLFSVTMHGDVLKVDDSVVSSFPFSLV